MTFSIPLLLPCAAALLLLVPSLRSGQEQAPAALPLDIRWGQLQWGELSPDGRELGLAGPDASLVLLDLETGRVRRVIPHHRGIQIARQEVDLEDAAWSPSGKLLARLYEDGRVEAVSTVDGALEATFTTSRPDEVAAVARAIRFAGEDSIVVACGGVPAELWSVSRGQRVAELEPGGATSASTVSHDGRLVALGDHEGNVSVFSVASGDRVCESVNVKSHVNDLDFSPDARKLAIASSDCYARVWEYGPSGSLVRLSHCDQDIFGGLVIGCVGFSPDGQRVVATSSSYWEARVWDVAMQKELWRHDYGGGNPGHLGAVFSSDGERVLLGLHGVVLDAQSGRTLRTLVPTEETRPWFHSDGQKAWALHEGRLLVFSLAGDCEKLLDLAVATSETEAK